MFFQTFFEMFEEVRANEITSRLDCHWLAPTQTSFASLELRWAWCAHSIPNQIEWQLSLASFPHYPHLRVIAILA